MEPYLKSCETSLGAITARCLEEISGVRSNRPNPQLIENVPVAAYGQTLTVREVGSISVVPPRTLLVNVWDASILQTVAKAIEEAKGGLSVTSDATGVRVSLPSMTDERRNEFSRLAKKIAEDARIQVRAVRDDTLKHMKSAEERKELTEDGLFKGKERIQKIVDAANQKIESVLAAKLVEIAE